MRNEASSEGARTGVLVMYHGTPRSKSEVLAFYTAIRKGRAPSPEQLAELERRYDAIGGLSPLHELTVAQVSGLKKALERLRPGRYVVRSGSKFSEPTIEASVAELVELGIPRAIGIVLAPHSSNVSVGEYARRARAAATTGRASREQIAGGLQLDVVESWHLEPGLVELLSERVCEAVGELRERGARSEGIEVVFSAHSVPVRSLAGGDRYPEEVRETAQAVAKSAGLARWQVAWQSAGRTEDQWLGPGLLEVISSLSESGASGVVVCPAGFVSDHLEILYDLDIEAAARAREKNVAFSRTRSLNDDPRFCEVLAHVVTAADLND